MSQKKVSVMPQMALTMSKRISLRILKIRWCEQWWDKCFLMIQVILRFTRAVLSSGSSRSREVISGNLARPQVFRFSRLGTSQLVSQRK